MQGQRGSLGREHNSSIFSHFLHSLLHAGYPRGCCHTVLCLRRLYPCYCSTFLLRRFDLAQRSLLFFRILDTTSHFTQEEITLHFGTSRPRPSCRHPSDSTPNRNCVICTSSTSSMTSLPRRILCYPLFRDLSRGSSNRCLLSWSDLFFPKILRSNLSSKCYIMAKSFLCLSFINFAVPHEVLDALPLALHASSHTVSHLPPASSSLFRLPQVFCGLDVHTHSRPRLQ